MSIDVRPAVESEMADYRRVASTSLMVSPEVSPQEAVQAVRPDMTLCAFEDGQLATAYAWWPLKMHFNGAVVPVAGITFVGTLPVFRRRGHLRRVITTHFETLHETGGYCLTVLIASQAAIYQRYGYGIVSSKASYTVAPRDLHFAQTLDDGGPPGQLRELVDGEEALLDQVYQAFCADRTGYFRRGKAIWAAGPLRAAPKNGALCKILYEKDGRPQGYVIYTIEGRSVPQGQPWQHIVIRDLAWLTPAAYRTLWHYFARMDLAYAVASPLTPIDDPLPHLLLEPRRLNTVVSDGVLARVVDVDRALAVRRYPNDGELRFELTDTLCPWNSGRWRMTVSDGLATVEKTTLASEAAMTVDTLAMLMFGQITPTQAARMGRMAISDRNKLAQWDGVMQTHYRSFCPDFF